MGHRPTTRTSTPAGNGQGAPALTLAIDPAALAPLVRAVVAEVIAQLEPDRVKIDESRLCFGEEEAAAMLGLRSSQLRDERRRGRIAASSIVGRRVRYQRADLVRYLSERRVNGG